MTHPEIQPVKFLFLNTAHPSEASTPRSLRRIRSHVAKENRARAARTRPTADAKAQYRVRQRKQTINSSITSSPCQTKGGEDAEKKCETAILPPILPDQSFSAVEPQWNPVRTLSAREIVLLDHYINHVILANKGRCHTAGISAQPWFTSMQLKCWLPFALADPGLLAALLLQSCRSLESLGTLGSYGDMYATYKQQCLRWVNECVSYEHRRASDASIAMVMVLLTESYVLGNLEEWKVHLDAHARMLKLRGGIDALGLDGFLRNVIVRSPRCYDRYIK
ncbi:hypothetical protein PG990_007065 [Apiospora arundinis]